MAVLFRPEFQAHHIFPKDIYNKLEAKFNSIDFFETLNLDANGNKILLSTDKDMAAFIQKNPDAFAGANIGGAHHDNHLTLNEWLKTTISGIFDNTNGLSGDKLKAYQTNQLLNLHQAVAEMIRAGEPPLSKASGAHPDAYAKYWKDKKITDPEKLQQYVDDLNQGRSADFYETLDKHGNNDAYRKAQLKKYIDDLLERDNLTPEQKADLVPQEEPPTLQYSIIVVSQVQQHVGLRT